MRGGGVNEEGWNRKNEVVYQLSYKLFTQLIFMKCFILLRLVTVMEFAFFFFSLCQVNMKGREIFLGDFIKKLN